MRRRHLKPGIFKSNFIVLFILITYIIYHYSGDRISNSIEDTVQKITVSCAKKQIMLYSYYKEKSSKDNSLSTPISLVYQYEKRVERSSIPELDKSDYTQETRADSKEKPVSQPEPAKQPETSKELETQAPVATVGNQAGNPAWQISPDQLSFDYLMKNYYTVAQATKVYDTDLNAPELMSMDMKMKQDNSCPQILIYHTHGQEGFTDTVPGDAGTRIIGVGDYLTQLLRDQYGYNVMHVTDSFDYVNGVLDRSKAYDYAYNKVTQVLADNPSIEVVLDIHRDGVNNNLHLITDVNGKPTAKIMFFNGMSRLATTGDIDYLYNPYRKDNLAMSLQMKVKAMENYPDFTRKNYLQAYEYNQQVRPKSMLIEAGAQTNSVGEVKNAMEPLASILHMVLQ